MTQLSHVADHRGQPQPAGRQAGEPREAQVAIKAGAGAQARQSWWEIFPFFVVYFHTPQALFCRGYCAHKLIFSYVKGGKAERDGGRSPIGGGGKATPPLSKDKVDHTKCDIVPGQDTVIEIIKVTID